MIALWMTVASLSIPVWTHAEPYKVYFGNLHSHTSYSDGSGTPAEAFAYAHDTGKLDFMAVTEHNHRGAEAGAKERRDGLMIATMPDLYSAGAANSVISAAVQGTQDEKFVALAGQEFSTISKGNHVNVFDIASVIRSQNGDFADLFQFLTTNLDSLGEPALVMLNHPGDYDGRAEYGEDDFPDRRTWIAALNKHASLIEVLSGPAMARRSGARPRGSAERDYFFYLNLGLYLAPTASQDNHYRTWGTATETRTAVLAKDLTKAGVLRALKARRAYATHDRNLRVWFRIDDHLMGDIVKADAGLTAVNATVRIEDDDEPGASYQVELLRDLVGDRELAAVVATRAVTGSGTVRFQNVRYRGGRQLYLIRIAQRSGRRTRDMLWTAPVWIEP